MITVSPSKPEGVWLPFLVFLFQYRDMGMSSHNKMHLKTLSKLTTSTQATLDFCGRLQNQQDIEKGNSVDDPWIVD